ncbi:MAG: DUF1801 domain-containing protein [Anaerolineaceae bacterium]
MAENKTKETEESVLDFLEKVDPAQRKADCFTLLEVWEKACGCEAKMWGSSIVGFGKYVYHYASGRSGEWMITGFSPRKGDLTLYLSCSLDAFSDQLPRLGKIKTGKGCIYIKKLEDIDTGVLAEMIQITHHWMAAQNNIYKA